MYLALLVLIAFTLASSQPHLRAQRPLRPETRPFEFVTKAFKNASIIPEGAKYLALSRLYYIVDDFDAEYLILSNWTTSVSAQLGNFIPPPILQKAPNLVNLTINNRPDLPNNVVVALTDPDARSRQDPDWSEVCHLLLYAHQPTTKPRPDLIMDYYPPNPPPHTGAHRYVILVFAPVNDTSDVLNLSKPSDRKHWGFKGTRVGARRWARENGLKPIGGNFFYSQNEEQ